MTQNTGYGIDFGGSGIKGARVDLDEGDFSADRTRIETPKPATPEAVADVARELADGADIPDDAPVGITVPSVVRRGTVLSAANIDPSWIGTDADGLFSDALGRSVHVVNDADAAGFAEARYGAAKGQAGLVVMTTLGTGIGTALVHEGVLVPNSELGHLEIDGHDAESRAANSAREDEDLDWAEWAERLTVYYRTVEALLVPDLFVVGGGVSKKSKHYLHLIDIGTPIVAGALGNRAGIVGAALLAREQHDTRS